MRRHGTGTVGQAKDGRWVGRLSLPGGKRKAVYGHSEDEATLKLNAARKELTKKGTDALPVASGLTLEEWGEQWLAARRLTLRKTTLTRYGELLRLHAFPLLGRKRLSAITPVDIRALYAACVAAGRSSSTAHHLHAVLHRCLKSAVNEHKLAYSPMDAVTAPRMAHVEYTVLDDAQVETLLDSLDEPVTYAVYLLAITTGIREGELMALRWQDVDLDADRATASGTAIVRGTRSSKGELLPTKTHGSRRLLILGPTLVEALRPLKGTRRADDFLFCSAQGDPLVRNFFDGRHYARLAAAGVPRVRFHDLRHSCATLLMERGASARVVADLLGHSTVTTTLNTYSHVTPRLQREAMLTMEGIVRSGRSRGTGISTGTMPVG